MAAHRAHILQSFSGYIFQLLVVFQLRLVRFVSVQSGGVKKLSFYTAYSEVKVAVIPLALPCHGAF